MRLVLDTNVVVSGLIWRGPPRQLLEAGRRGRVALFSSASLLDELASVLKRDKFSARLAALPHYSDAADAALRYTCDVG